jgi:hypothetical protein
MVTAWSLHSHCMVTAWSLHGHCMVTAWSLHGHCMVTAWSQNLGMHSHCIAQRLVMLAGTAVCLSWLPQCWLLFCFWAGSVAQQLCTYNQLSAVWVMMAGTDPQIVCCCLAPVYVHTTRYAWSLHSSAAVHCIISCQRFG